MAEDRKFTIAGPGAADFLAAGGREDLPGTGPSEGMSQTRGESTSMNPRTLVPRPGPDTEAAPGERASGAENTAPDQRPGSQTGSIGGGADAHNTDPVRTTAVDDPTTTSARKPAKKRTTKKY